MPKRTPIERSSDWFSLGAHYLIRVIESTKGLDAPDQPDAVPSSDQFISHIRSLGTRAHEAGGPAPCRIEVWTGEGAPRHAADKFWVAQETRFAEDEEGRDFAFFTPEGPRRLHALNGQTWKYLDLDSDARWFWHHRDGTFLSESLRWVLSIHEPKVQHRMSPGPPSLRQLDLQALADDLEELHRRMLPWFDAPDAKAKADPVQKAVDRLWLRMNDGEIDLIDESPGTRRWLSGVWTDLLWVQRWLEQPSSRCLKPYLPYEVEVRSLPFLENARRARAGCEAIASAAERGTGVDKSTKPTRVTVNQRMWGEIALNPTVAVQWTKDEWAARLNCAPSAVLYRPKSLEADKLTAWERCKAEQKRLKQDREIDPRLRDDFMEEKHRTD